ncbi:MAG: hypothetical protein A4S14_01950 [Proteobacteria bacterium SG_bin9]|nr:MAG: hypothetical protein A4S14_01950 [Proteobacteria bacterium SG_bin9]
MMRTIAATLVAAAISFPATTANSAKDELGFVRVKPGEEEWKNPFGTGVEVATIHGDPSKPGIYVLRIKWPKGIMSAPHMHNEDRHVVVLSGKWYTGTGETLDQTKAVPLEKGAYMLHPAGAVHWDGTREEEAIIQIIGYGPSSTKRINEGGPNFVKE